MVGFKEVVEESTGQQVHSVSAVVQRLFARGRVRHGTGRLAQDQFGIEENVSSHGPSCGVGDQALKDEVSNPLPRNINGCEARVGKFRKFDVVKPGHRNIFENTQSLVAEFTQDSKGHKVIHTHNRRRPKARG
jgi:hypothetical protein